MRRSTLQILALHVLTLLGAPVALHFVMHDLHHDERANGDSIRATAGHGDHDHPIVSSPVPQMPSLVRAVVAVIVVTAANAPTWRHAAHLSRNFIAHGAIRLDEDVGLQPLLSTFLI